jgi:phosphatidylethanolamine/phosphatidyl-N-methylethanolamine N-methyltransferase
MGPLGKARMTKTLATYWHFFWAGLAKQSQTGAIVPSQRFLIARMIAPVPPDYRGQIIELGPGTGALTRRLAARCPNARILACEINPDLAQILSGQLAAAGLKNRVKVVTRPAQDLLSEMKQRGTEKPDFIISGIPLAHLAREQVLTLISAVNGALTPGGLYVQYQHSLLDRRNIRALFPRLRSVPVLLNFPPAIVYYARKS